VAIDGEGLATLNGTAMGTDNELGRVSFYYQELAGGQVSQSISGCPTCAQKLSAIIRSEITKAKEQVNGQVKEKENPTPAEGMEDGSILSGEAAEREGTIEEGSIDATHI